MTKSAHGRIALPGVAKGSVGGIASERSATLPLCFLGAHSALRLNPDSVVDRRSDALFAAEVSFGGLD